MIATERALQHTLRDLLHKPPMRLWIKQQDTHTTGTPDCLSIRAGRVTQVELKYIRPTDISKVDGTFLTGVRPAQRVWLRDWHRAGGRGWLWIGVHDRLYVLHPMGVPEVKTRVDVFDLERLAERVVKLSREELAAQLPVLLEGR